MTPHITLSGDREAIANVRKVAEAIGDDRMREFALEAMEVVAEEARVLVRVDSGLTRDSIGVGETLFDGSHRQFHGRAVFVGVDSKDAYYASFLEFGTINMPPYPFLTPAVDAKEGEVFDILGELAGEAMLSAV